MPSVITPCGGGGGGGIQFDTSPQSGGWLELTMTSEKGFGSGGLNVDAAKGIQFYSGTGPFNFYAHADSSIYIERSLAIAGLGMTITAGASTLVLNAGDTIQANATFLELNGDNITLNPAVAVLVSNLPITDPGVTNQLWNDGGTVKISL